MIKSTKLERMAIEARLRDALAIKGNSDIEATLNTIIDYNNVEKLFLKLHKKYENLFITEYHNACTFAGQYRGHGSKHDIDNERIEFIKSFNELAELFSNVVEVQRQKRETDKIIDNDSKGTAIVVRGGKNHGVHLKQSSLQATAPGNPMKWNPSAKSPGHVGVVRSCTNCNTPFTSGSVNELICSKCRGRALANKILNKSGNCIDCGKRLIYSATGHLFCNSCFLKTLVYVCQDCKQTFSPLDINQKTCISCQNVNLGVATKAKSNKQPSPLKCTKCKQPLKRSVHPFLCNKCSAIIAGVSAPKKPHFIQRFLNDIIHHIN